MQGEIVNSEITERTELQDLDREGAIMALNKEHLGLLINSIQVGVVLIDAETHLIVDLNAKAEEMIGCKRSDILQKECHEFIYPAKHGQCPITDLGLTVDNAEKILITWAGEKIPILKTVKKIEIDGHFYILDSFVDLTDLKATQNALRESEERFKKLSNLTFEGILIHEMGVAIDVNESFQSMFGYTREELIGQNVIKLLIPQEFHETVRGNIIQECAKPYEVMARKKDGTLFPIELEAKNVMRNGEGFRVAAIRDITERKKLVDTLRNSEERFRAVFSSARDGIIKMDHEGNIVLWNPAAEKIFGYKGEEIVGKNLHNLIAPGRFHPAHQKGLMDFIKTGQGPAVGQTIELVGIHRDGQEIPVELSLSSVKINGDWHAVGVVRDISFRKVIQEAILREKEKAESYLNLAGVMFIALDRNGDITLINPKGCEVLETDESTIIGSNWFDNFICKESRDEIRSVFDKLMAGDIEAVERHENTILSKGGHKKTIAWHNSILRDENGNIIGLLSSGEDVTEQRVFQDTIRDSEARYRLLSDNAADVIWTLDINTQKFTYFSPSVQRLRGFTPEEAMALPLGRAMTPESLKNTATDLKKGLEEEKILGIDPNRVHILQLEELCKDGSVIHVEAQVKFLRDANGRPTGVIGSSRDVTARKKAEASLLESEAQYRLLVDNTDTGFVVIDDKGIVIHSNEAYQRIAGAERNEDLVGHSVIEWTAPDMLENNEKAVALCASQGFIKDFETVYQHSNGKRVYITINATVKETPDGRKNIISFCRDITQRKIAENALKTIQDQLAEAMDMAQLVNWEFDVANGLFTFDDRFYAFYGTTAELEGGHRMSADVYAQKYVHPEDMGVVGNEVNKAILASDPDYTSQVEHRIIRRDGEIRHIIVRFGIIKDKNGRTIKTHGANQDITERKKAEEAMRESEAWVKAIFNALQTGVVVVDVEMRTVVDVNPVAVKMLGVDRESIIGNPCYQFFHSGIDKQCPILDAELNLDNSERFLINQNGEQVPILKNVVRATMNGRQYLVESFVDLTDQKRSEQAMRESEQKYRLLSENSSDVIWSIDFEGNFLYVSPSVETLRGFTSEEVMKQPIDQVLMPEGIALFERELAAIVQSLDQNAEMNHTRIFELEQPCKDGTTVWTEVSASLMLNENGMPMGVQGVSRDITERRKLESTMKVNLHDLEQYKKATIDRELKMVELKEEMRALKEKQRGG